MDPVTGISLILSLIPLYLRERDKEKAASKEDFYAWLLEHKFQDVKDCITNNFALEVEIADALKMNHDELLSRLDGIDEQLARILYGVDCFRALAKTIAPTACLSPNQEELLRAIVNSGGTTFAFRLTINSGLVFYGNFLHLDLSKVDEKFIPQSAEILTNHGFLMRRGEAYMLTEAGQDYINSLDKIKASDE